MVTISLLIFATIRAFESLFSKNTLILIIFLFIFSMVSFIHLQIFSSPPSPPSPPSLLSPPSPPSPPPSPRKLYFALIISPAEH